MNGYNFIMTFKNMLDLNALAARLFATLNESPFSHIATSPAVIIYATGNNDQLVVTPNQLQFIIQREYEYSEVSELLPYVRSTFLSILDNSPKYYFTLRFADIQLVERATAMEQSYNGLSDVFSASIRNEFVGLGYRFFTKVQLDVEVYDEFKIEPLLSDNQYWYLEGIYHCEADREADLIQLHDVIFDRFTRQKNFAKMFA